VEYLSVINISDGDVYSFCYQPW